MSEMSEALPPETGPARRRRHFTLDIGEALGNTFRIWMRNVIPFFVMAVLVYLPYEACSYYILRTDFTEQSAVLGASAVRLVTMLLAVYLLTGAVTYAVLQQLRGRPAGIGRCLGVGLSRVLPVFGVAFLSMISIFFGMLLLVIPGLVLMCMFYVAVPATIVEDLGPFAALSRSSDLTRGFKWTIFGIVFVIAILIFLIQLPIGFLIIYVKDFDLRFILSVVVSLLFAPLGSILAAVVYHDLRVGKEGANIEDLAAVFE